MKKMILLATVSIFAFPISIAQAVPEAPIVGVVVKREEAVKLKSQKKKHRTTASMPSPKKRYPTSVVDKDASKIKAPNIYDGPVDSDSMEIKPPPGGFAKPPSVAAAEEAAAATKATPPTGGIGPVGSGAKTTGTGDVDDIKSQ